MFVGHGVNVGGLPLGSVLRVPEGDGVIVSGVKGVGLGGTVTEAAGVCWGKNEGWMRGKRVAVGVWVTCGRLKNKKNPPNTRIAAKARIVAARQPALRGIR